MTTKQSTYYVIIGVVAGLALLGLAVLAALAARGIARQVKTYEPPPLPASEFKTFEPQPLLESEVFAARYYRGSSPGARKCHRACEVVHPVLLG